MIICNFNIIRIAIPALPFCHLKLKGKKPQPGYPKELKTIGDHIRKKRMDLRLYQKDVAEIIGVTESTVYNWENNRTTNPPVSIYPKIYMFIGYVPYDPGMPFHEKLIVWRRALGLTQDIFARQIGVDPSTVFRWEKGKGRPDYNSLYKFVCSLI